MGMVLPDRLGPVGLEAQVVDEGVRWLDGTARVQAQMLPEQPLPDRRPAAPGRPARRRWRRQPPAVQIPRVLHRVWRGPRPLPDQFVAYGESWRRHHPAWTLKLWTDADAPRPAGIERARNLAERSDLVRYEVLRRHGGVYVDTDVECLRPIDDLLDGVQAFAAYEVPGRLCNAVLGAVPGHPAITRATELVALTAGRGVYPDATATSFITYVLEADETVTLFGPERFYPTLWDDRVNDAPAGDPPHTVHHWAHSWGETPPVTG
jgi:hypothetical protein